MRKIVIPDDAPPLLITSPAFRELADLGEVAHFSSLPSSREQLMERIRGAEIVINIRSSSKFTGDVFRHSPGMRLLSVWGTGTDNIELVEASQNGVTVTNTPRVSAFSVAEHALALMLAVAHGIAIQDTAVRAGNWPRGQGVELRNKTLGVIGMGAIGSRFAELGRAIGMRVVAWTLHPKPAAGVVPPGHVEFVEFDELLRSSDVISFHTRLSPQTEGLIGMREFELMKRSAIVVNTARGAIVDEAALIEVLKSKRIAGAGLDVFETEPLPAGHPLTRLPNVVLTPHSAGITPEALDAGLQMAVANVRNFLNGAPTNVVAAGRRSDAEPCYSDTTYSETTGKGDHA